ncbi:MAG: glycosyltransferase, partial [Cytophagales bacterium]
LGLDKVVMFEEATDDIEAVMKKADVVLMFSESESFSMVCYEALFYGKPLIASDCGGPRELVENNVSGLLVTNRDTHAMANAMCTLVNYNELRYVLSINARKAIRDKMVDNLVSTKLGEVYKHFIA